MASTSAGGSVAAPPRKNSHVASSGMLEVIGSMHGIRFSTSRICGGGGGSGGGHLCAQLLKGSVESSRESPRVILQDAFEVITCLGDDRELGRERLVGGLDVRDLEQELVEVAVEDLLVRGPRVAISGALVELELELARARVRTILAPTRVVEQDEEQDHAHQGGTQPGAQADRELGHAGVPLGARAVAVPASFFVVT